MPRAFFADLGRVYQGDLYQTNGSPQGSTYDPKKLVYRMVGRRERV